MGREGGGGGKCSRLKQLFVYIFFFIGRGGEYKSISIEIEQKHETPLFFFLPCSLRFLFIVIFMNQSGECGTAHDLCRHTDW